MHFIYYLYDSYNICMYIYFGDISHSFEINFAEESSGTQDFRFISNHHRVEACRMSVPGIYSRSSLISLKERERER